jgi:hypothetical protein
MCNYTQVSNLPQLQFASNASSENMLVGTSAGLHHRGAKHFCLLTVVPHTSRFPRPQNTQESRPAPSAIKSTGQLLGVSGDSRFPRQPVTIFRILRAVLRVRLQTAMPSTPVGKAILVIYRPFPRLSSCTTCNTNQLFLPSSIATSLRWILTMHYPLSCKLVIFMEARLVLTYL